MTEKNIKSEYLKYLYLLYFSVILSWTSVTWIQIFYALFYQVMPQFDLNMFLLLTGIIYIISVILYPSSFILVVLS